MIQKKSTLYKQKKLERISCLRPSLHSYAAASSALRTLARCSGTGWNLSLHEQFFVRTFLSFRFLFFESPYSAKSSKLTPEPAFTSCLSVFPVISSRNFGLIPGVRTFSVRKTATSPFFIFSPAFMSFIKCRLRFVRP